VLLGRIEDAGIVCHACTEDGSHGIAGRVTAALEPRLRELQEGSAGREGSAAGTGGAEGTPANPGNEAEVLACGPLPMLRAVRQMCAERGVRCLLSLETEMACGVGICRGCMVRRAGEQGYLCTCVEGPVVDAQEVIP
jgi:dihydroorotate dehydrogenase electron transfer subunit